MNCVIFYVVLSCFLFASIVLLTYLCDDFYSFIIQKGMAKLRKNSRVVLLLVAVMGGALFSSAGPLPSSVPIILQVGWHDPTGSSGELPRNLVNPPSASLDDHTLYINSEHPAYTLYLVDTTGEEPYVVYQVYVPANVSVVVLPSTLSGTYELQLYDGGDYYFYSEIEL